jgi:hypothetical protein
MIPINDTENKNRYQNENDTKKPANLNRPLKRRKDSPVMGFRIF